MILKVTLEKDENYVPPSEEETGTKLKPEKPEVEKVRVGFTVTPASAVIRKDGKEVGTGKFSAEFSPGETVKLTISDPLYEEQQVEVKIGEETGQEYSYSLKLRPIVRTFPISESRILLLRETNEGLLAMDGAGMVFLMNQEGTVDISFQSGIVPAGEVQPVFTGDRMYLLGENRLVVADVRRGNILFDLEVSGADRFTFGRRVAVVNGKGVFPSNDTISFFSTDSGEVLDERKIAQGMAMTPLKVGNTLVTVNRKGQILILDENGEYNDIIPTTVLSDGNVFAVNMGDSIYFVDDRGNAVCLNGSTGKIVWESDALASTEDRSAPRYFFLEPGSNGLYLYDGERVALLSKAGGNLHFVTDGGVSAPPLVKGGNLYLSSGKGELQVLDGVTGKKRSSVPIGAPGTSKPVAVGNFLLLGLENGEAIVINPQALN
jgi:outer membrane protein assembly factor BamB